MFKGKMLPLLAFGRTCGIDLQARAILHEYEIYMNMKTSIGILLAGLLCVQTVRIQAQPGGRGGMAAGPRGPQLSGSTAKLFGENAAFSANLEMQSKGASADETMTMPGKIAFAEGKSRFEMDMTQMKGSQGRPEAAAQMRTMGMDKMIMISRPDKKVSYMVYPGLQTSAETPLPESETGKPASDFKVETTELGRETVDGHACVKNKAVVIDSEGNRHESTVWNATDLNKFPVKIEHNEQGALSTMLFKDVKLSKPEASLFDPPAGLTRYDNVQTLMQQQMMKRFRDGDR